MVRVGRGAQASCPFYAIVLKGFDGGAPEYIRKELHELCAERPFELVECEDFVLPNKARNIALDRVKTKYVAFCDNDLEYWPGWLNALVENAEANGSAAVSPLTFFGPSDPPMIHHAGGSFVFCKDSTGRRLLWDDHRYGSVRLPEAEADKFSKAPLDHKVFEYHCVLVAAEAMRAVGGHDERLIMHEHCDSSLRLMMAGGRLTFEPSARITYQVFVRFEDEDWPYFLFRWALHRLETSDRVFAENWGVDSRSRFVHWHRERAMFSILPRLPKYLNRGKIKRALLKFYQPHILSLDKNQPDDKAPLVLPVFNPPMMSAP
jgi:GT2 family glycosyltransferase